MKVGENIGFIDISDEFENGPDQWKIMAPSAVFPKYRRSSDCSGNNLENPEMILILTDLVSGSKIMAKFGITQAISRKVSRQKRQYTESFMNTPIM